MVFDEKTLLLEFAKSDLDYEPHFFDVPELSVRSTNPAIVTWTNFIDEVIHQAIHLTKKTYQFYPKSLLSQVELWIAACASKFGRQAHPMLKGVIITHPDALYFPCFFYETPIPGFQLHPGGFGFAFVEDYKMGRSNPGLNIPLEKFGIDIPQPIMQRNPDEVKLFLVHLLYMFRTVRIRQERLAWPTWCLFFTNAQCTVSRLSFILDLDCDHLIRLFPSLRISENQNRKMGLSRDQTYVMSVDLAFEQTREGIWIFVKLL